MWAGCAPSPGPRPVRALDELVAARQADDAARLAEARHLSAKLLRTHRGKSRGFPEGGVATTRPTIDLLVISGGGDWGAFGAGVLKGWSRVSGELARPQFDVVTGVSTVAMIAPFAFLGDDESIERIVQLYRNPQADWTKSARGRVLLAEQSLLLRPAGSRARDAENTGPRDARAHRRRGCRSCADREHHERRLRGHACLGHHRRGQDGAGRERRGARIGSFSPALAYRPSSRPGASGSIPTSTARSPETFSTVAERVTRIAFRRAGRRSIPECRCRVCATGSSSTTSSGSRRK